MHKSPLTRVETIKDDRRLAPFVVEEPLRRNLFPIAQRTGKALPAWRRESAKFYRRRHKQRRGENEE